MSTAIPFVDYKLKQRKIILFSKTDSPECKMAKQILDQYNFSDQDYETVEINRRQDCGQIENYFQVLCLTDSRKVPHLFAGGQYIGDDKQINLLHQSGELKQAIDLAVLPEKH